MENLTPLIISLIVMFIGILGIFLPVIPDLIFIFLGALIYGIWTKFATMPWWILVIFGLFVGLGYLFDWLGIILGAKKYKASIWGIFGALLGAFLGIFLGGLLGIILFSFAGTILFEIIFAKKSFDHSLKAGIGSLIGLIAAVIFKFVLAAIMIGWFLLIIF